jgi:ribosomal protein L11 methyltransferase
MRFHRPVEVGSLWIGPPWEEPTPGLVPVVIDPGLAFGTGAHPTTQLCLELIQPLERSSLLDIGSGSGVLAIAACKLGYEPVVAIDVDEAAVAATRLNAEANGVRVEAALLDAGAGTLPESEIVVANIDLGTVSRLEPPARCRVLATSGYYETDRPEFPEFVHADRLVREAWAADLFRRE